MGCETCKGRRLAGRRACRGPVRMRSWAAGLEAHGSAPVRIGPRCLERNDSHMILFVTFLRSVSRIRGNSTRTDLLGAGAASRPAFCCRGSRTSRPRSLRLRLLDRMPATHDVSFGLYAFRYSGGRGTPPSPEHRLAQVPRGTPADPALGNPRARVHQPPVLRTS